MKNKLTVEQVREKVAHFRRYPGELDEEEYAALADAYLELVEAARRVLNYGPIEFRHGHAGVTQLGDCDGWIRARDALRAVLPPEEPGR